MLSREQCIENGQFCPHLSRWLNSVCGGTCTCTSYMLQYTMYNIVVCGVLCLADLLLSGL